MSEGPPKAPKPERAPKLTKEAVIEHLQQSPQELGPYLEWIDARHAEIESIADTRGRDTANIDLTLEMGEVCREAGFLESARENFEWAATQADNIGDAERRDQAQAALDALPKPS